MLKAHLIEGLTYGLRKIWADGWNCSSEGNGLSNSCGGLPSKSGGRHEESLQYSAMESIKPLQINSGA